MTVLATMQVAAQGTAIVQDQGYCGADVKYDFDGYTMTITNVSKKGLVGSIANYSTKRPAPWVRKNLPVKRVRIGNNIERIGSCAFAGCHDLLDVEFQSTDVREIGWGAFLNCSRLRNISLPNGLKKIETVAFANCTSLTSIKIPDQCRLEDQAFVSCTNMQTIDISPTSIVGHYAFASEVNVNGKIRHTLYNGEVRRLPVNITAANSREFGIAQEAVEKFSTSHVVAEEYDVATSEVDKDIPSTGFTKNNTFALIIGNQNYRFVSNVPFAIHDSHTFAEYCEKCLGLPSENIYICDDATKQMIMEDGMEWVRSVKNREDKRLIVYYAGHGVPDTKNKNKAYLLPTDVRGTKPYQGVSLDDFYATLGSMQFEQVTVFLDACFSGINRDNDAVNEGLRGVEIDAEEGTISTGNMVVFSAAQGNETAQGYLEQGHGLFTYYLLKELKESYGSVNYGSLADSLSGNVSKQAKQLKLRKPQTPSANASESVADTWRDMNF